MTHTDQASPTAGLTAAEIDAAREIVVGAGLVTAATRFVYMGVDEPDKSEVLAFLAGDGARPDRRVRVLLLDMADGASHDVRVSLGDGAVIRATAVSGDDGRLPVAIEEFELVGEVLAADETWLAALRDRGVDPAQVVCNPLSAGWFGLPGEEGRRMLRVTSLVMSGPTENPWAHPIDGLSAYVDTIAREVIAVNDIARVPVPEPSGNFQDPAEAGPALEGLKPLEIVQPEGPSFTIDGETVSWANWRVDVGFDPREGVVLHRIAFRDGGAYRPIVYRASVAEMVVPYGDPHPARFWQNYFDTGEYLFGRFSNSLVLGCDCLGEIRYLDAVLSDELGRPTTIPNAICVHEEDTGALWKHSDQFTGVSEVRRGRRLVISFFTTIGNYDYGFFWHLYLDGTIELEAKLTGILFTSGYQDGDRHATRLGESLGAPFHQHLFSARLDMQVDGLANAVEEVDAVREPIGPDNPYGNAFTRRAVRLRRESEGARLADASVDRTWHVISTERTNHVGGPTGYLLRSPQAPTLMADPASSIASRAAFTTRHLWVTRYDRDERYPAGDLVNQSRGGGGLPVYVAQDRDIDGQDIVLWHTFGPTHFPRLEDWPVMPVDRAGFQLRPYGFFDRNPALNVPAPHCAVGGEHGHHGHAGHASS